MAKRMMLERMPELKEKEEKVSARQEFQATSNKSKLRLIGNKRV